MSPPRPKDDDTVDALESLLEGPRRQARPSTPPAPSTRPPAVPLGRPYRCLECGYALAGLQEFRCPECGRSCDPDTLDLWFDGTERARFDHVLWLVAASLLLRLFVLPDLLFVSRLGIAIVIAWACRVASRAKAETVGGYYAVAGMIAAGLMLFAFAWAAEPLAFHTLDIMTAGLLVQAMLYDPAGHRLGLATGGRWLALGLLLVAPLLALWCHIMDEMRGATLVPANPLLAPYPPFRFAIPYVAAAIAWVVAWLTLAGVRRTLFGGAPTD